MLKLKMDELEQREKHQRSIDVKMFNHLVGNGKRNKW